MKQLWMLGLLVLLGAGCATTPAEEEMPTDTPSEQAGEAPSDESPALEQAPSSDAITVTAPLVNQEVGSTILVEGEARVFEQTFNWRLTDVATGNDIEGFDMTNAADIGQFGPFSFAIEVPEAFEGELLLEVFESSAKDGSQIHTVEVPLIR